MLFAFRLLMLAVIFILSSVAGLLLGLVRPFNPDNSRVCARLYAWPAMWALGLSVKLDTELVKHHQRSAVILGNHLSNYDLFVFGNVVPERTVSLGKKSLKWIPLFGQLYWLAGNVLIDRGNGPKAKQAMLSLTDTLQHKDMSIWVFPEGTRNHGRGLGTFKKGAFVMAVNAGVPIIPVCSNTYVKQMRLNRWRSGHILLRALPPIPTAGLTVEDVPALMARCHAQMTACIEALDREVLALG